MESRSALWVAAMLVLSQTAAAEDVEGLLLGVRSTDGLATVLVDTEGRIDELGAGIAVPRARGWWLVDVIPSDFHWDHLVSIRASRRMRCPALKDREGERAITLTFIGPNLLSYEVSSREPGGAHSMESRYLGTRTLDSEDLIPVGAVLDESQVNRFETLGKAASTISHDSFGSTGWGVIRSDREWKIRGAVGPNNETSRGTLEYFGADIKVPESVTGPGQREGLSWSPESAGLSGLSDGFAPTSTLQVTISKDGEVRVYRRSSKAAPWTLATQRRLDAFDVVMAQPVLGTKNLERWRSEARALLAQNPCRSK